MGTNYYLVIDACPTCGHGELAWDCMIVVFS